MMITKISEQAKNPDRANIHVDGKFYAGINKLVVVQLGLRVGLELSPELAGKLSQLEGTNNVWDYALRSLSVAPKSRSRMIRKLTEKFDAETAKETVEKLSQDGLVNDELLASNIVSTQIRMETKSRMEIAAMLSARGIDKEAAKVALDQIYDDYEARAIQHLVEVKSRGTTKDGEELRQKIGQYLARKGFGYPAIKKALVELGSNVE
jgi:regulatory protein